MPGKDTEDTEWPVQLFEQDDSRRRFLKGLASLSLLSGAAGCVGGGGSDGGGGGSDGGGGGSDGGGGGSDGGGGGDGGGGDGGGGDGGGGGTQTTGGSGEGGAESGSTLIANIHQEFSTAGVHRETNYAAGIIRVNSYDHLFEPTVDGEIKPRLVDDFTVTDSGKLYTFKLRDDVTFHSGNQLTAEDVKFSLDRYFDLNQGFSSTSKPYVSKENVTVKGKYEIEFKLDQPFVPFVGTLIVFAILDKQVVVENEQDGKYGEHGDYGTKYLNTHTAGSGPYEMTSFDPASEAVLRKNDDYWREFPDNSFDEVRIKVIPEDSTVKSLMRAGELDFTSHFQALSTYNSLKKESGIKVTEDRAIRSLMLNMNMQREPTSDLNLRKALSWAFDYKTAVEQGQGVRKYGPLSSIFKKTYNDNIVKVERDLDKAKKFLEQAEYSPGSDDPLQLLFVSGDELRRNMGLIFQSSMKDIGVDVELNGWPWSRVSSVAGSEDPTKIPHVVTMFGAPLYPHPHAFFQPQYHSEAANTWANMERMNNKKVDRLIDRAARTTDPKKRRQIYKQLQKIITSLYPDIWIQDMIIRHAVQKEIKGHEHIPGNGYQYTFWDLHK